VARLRRLSLILTVLVAAAGVVRARVPSTLDHGASGRRPGTGGNAAFRAGAPDAPASTRVRPVGVGHVASRVGDVRAASSDGQPLGASLLAILPAAWRDSARRPSMPAGAADAAGGPFRSHAPSAPRAPPIAPLA
jgi:hypothetical protein